ncbi:hypothetical protein BJ165DRAFT_1535341 [Panaeolus papilionaceus]|nr:hypothetical protein BJ165DRAFT_1535341 [Panaeolus papilionaceus]
MPQPKIHQSTKARQQANRDKSKRHYQSNKEDINSRRRALYHKKRFEAAKKSEISQEATASQETSGVETKQSPVDTWLERAGRIHGRFLKYLDGSGVQFLHKTCREYLKEENGDSIINCASTLQEYRLSILRCHDNVLQLAGVGNELEKVESMVQDIKRVIDWLDEVEMAALEEFNEVRKLYHKGGFDFQKRA